MADRSALKDLSEAQATILAPGWVEISNDPDGSHQLFADERWVRNALPSVREFMHRVRTGREGAVRASIGPARRPPSMDRKGHLRGLRGQIAVEQTGPVLALSIDGRMGAHLHKAMQGLVNDWDAEDTIAP